MERREEDENGNDIRIMRKPLLDWVVENKMLYIILALSFVLYLATKVMLFALLTALSVIVLFIAESVYSAEKTGWKNELKEILVAVLVAGAVWYGGGLLLHTTAPLDAVVSCSMLPNLERGDMVILQGGVAQAPEVSISQAEFNSNDWQAEKIVCAFCERVVGGSVVREPCVAATKLTDQGLIVTGEADQSGNLVKYECGTCMKQKDDGSATEVPCTKAVMVKGQRIAPNMSNDIVVYTPLQGDIFRGETIHRVLLRINADGQRYYLMKGDNNEQLDMQYGNSAAPQGKIVGRVLVRLPYLGYLKLFLFGFLATPAGCDSVLLGQ